MLKAGYCFPIIWVSRVSIPCSATPQLLWVSEKQQLFLSCWPRSEPAATLHPSHSFTGWNHFHNRSLDTFPALSTALPKHLETICHLPHQHSAIILSPQHTNLLYQLLLPALPPTILVRNKAPGTASEHSKPGKQEGRAISPSVCLFVIEEQPNLTGPGSFTSSSWPSAWFWLQPEQEMSTRPRRAAALPCCRAEYTFTQAQTDPQRQEVFAVTPQQGTLQLSSAVLTLGQSRAGPKQQSPGADSRGNYCSSLEFAGMEVVQDKAELGLPHSGASHQLPYRIR